MTTPPFITQTPTTPALGLIVLRVDETIEQDFRTLIPAGTARLHVSRVQSGDDLNPGTIHDMGTRLTAAAELLPKAAGFDVVGYACTSATAQLGSDAVRAQIKAGIPTRHVTDPLTAALAQIASLGLTRVGVISPYTSDVAAPINNAFRAAGIEVPDMASFDESTEARVARIAPSSTYAAAIELAARTPLDGVFLSCTNLQTLPILQPLQDALGLPVLSSNAALAWHMSRLADLTTPG
ncbi:aspartate/glutamate racemase family protein [uncultured Tateyamaria sp.]|uniref:maleate cis-trans isomerase family protein n=1 Tax=Tateyamaria sp. 1078 TaxID=3417464 RepID=UPI0026294EB0|nr:aspartate/glutamate racemase family protein [uncultured Tateyamaria sp.]